MKKKIIAMLLVLVLVISIIPAAAFATENTPPSVTVYLSVTDDGVFAGSESDPDDCVMALQKITVPYFDLGDYDLEDYYFNSDYMGVYEEEPGWEGPDPDHPLPPKSDLTPGTADYAYGFVTMLHLFIYAMEVYYYGIDPALAGQGYLKNAHKLGTSDITISGTVGSLFFDYYWGMDYNLNYYLNYEYPIASAGWGATADQILLQDNDVVTLGHFTYDYDHNYIFDPNNVFAYAKPTSGNISATVTPVNDTVNLTFYHAGLDFLGINPTAHTIFGAGIEVFCSEAGMHSVIGSDIEDWDSLGYTDINGHIEIDTSDWDSGSYVVGIPGQYGSVYTSTICCTPGGIIIEVP